MRIAHSPYLSSPSLLSKGVSCQKCHVLAATLLAVSGGVGITCGVLFSAYLATATGALLTIGAIAYGVFFCRKAPVNGVAPPFFEKNISSPEGPLTYSQLAAFPFGKLEVAQQLEFYRHFKKCGNEEGLFFLTKQCLNLTLLAEMEKNDIDLYYGDRLILSFIKEEYTLKSFGVTWEELGPCHEKIISALVLHADRHPALSSILRYFEQHPENLILQGQPASKLALNEFLKTWGYES